MIIKSLLDQDLYKFTMGQVAFHQFPEAIVKYRFKCRNKDIQLDIKRLQEEISYLCSLNVYSDELEYLSTLGFFKDSYLEFLRLLKLNPWHVRYLNDENGNLYLEVKGPWFLTIYFEIPILAIINELYFENQGNLKLGEELLQKKIEILKGTTVKFADFGTRRRYSGDWQNRIIDILKKELPDNFIGTSNLYLAHTYNIKPVGTMAHEFLQAAQALEPRVKDSQKYALQCWANEYRGNLGIALTDVVGYKAFLRDFDLYFSKLFDGVRHDSGNPEDWGIDVIDHYKKMGIDPRTKTLVFSDGLTFPKMLELEKRFYGVIKTAYGIGTNLTNDVGVDPLNIVIKMVECNGAPVAKISDSPGKQMCEDAGYLSYLRSVFNISKET
jgi:nicotinate phosphoribosyltransferase